MPRGVFEKGQQKFEVAIHAPFFFALFVPLSFRFEMGAYFEGLMPVGVVASIVPFNFPAMVPLWCLGDCSD